MKRMTPLAAGLAAVAMGFAPMVAAQQQPPQQQQPRPEIKKTHLKVGDTAPDFTLPDTTRQPVKLSDFRGKKNVVLVFYVLAFTGG